MTYDVHVHVWFVAICTILQHIVTTEARTLLPHYLGMYRLTVNSAETYWMVMRNVFSARLKVHRKFDLKGSTVDRQASTKEKVHYAEVCVDGVCSMSLYHSVLGKCSWALYHNSLLFTTLSAYRCTWVVLQARPLHKNRKVWWHLYTSSYTSGMYMYDMSILLCHIP